MHKINFENATERATVKEHMLLPPNDGQVKHPEPLQPHEMLQVLQRHALNGDVEECERMIAQLPDYQQSDTRAMLRGAVKEHGREIDL